MSFSVSAFARFASSRAFSNSSRSNARFASRKESQRDPFTATSALFFSPPLPSPLRLLVCLLHEADCFEVVLDAQGGLRPLQDVPHLVDVDFEVLDLHDLLLHEVEQVLRRGNDVLPGAP